MHYIVVKKRLLFPLYNGLDLRSCELEMRNPENRMLLIDFTCYVLHVLSLLAHLVVLRLQLLSLHVALLHSFLGVINVLKIKRVFPSKMDWPVDTLTRLRVCFLSCVIVSLKFTQSDNNLLGRPDSRNFV